MILWWLGMQPRMLNNNGIQQINSTLDNRVELSYNSPNNSHNVITLVFSTHNKVVCHNMYAFSRQGNQCFTNNSNNQPINVEESHLELGVTCIGVRFYERYLTRNIRLHIRLFKTKCTLHVRSYDVIFKWTATNIFSYKDFKIK